MTEVNIFNGPSSEFLKRVPERHTTLTELAKAMDSRKNIYVVKSTDDMSIPEFVPPSHILVIHAEELHGLNESFLLSLVPQIASLDFDEIYLQNPPAHIFKQLKRVSDEFEVENFKYKEVTKSLIKKINNEYEKEIIGQSNVKREILLSLIPLLNKKFNKPIVLMFYGPAGVGKTESAKFISKTLGGKLFRKQFSMFQNTSYSNYLYGGSLNEESFALELLGRTANVILLDEFDKVSSHFHSAFYEFFDEGIFTDKNYKVNMKKSIIICTSNFESEEQIKHVLGEAMHSRFDNFIEFNALAEEDKKKIINLKIEHKLKLYSINDREKIDEVKIKLILNKNLNLVSNVREIDKAIQKLISLELLNNIIN